MSLGHYYREGIADSDVKADLGRARHMYAYAASYFADPDAQYHLGRLLLDGTAANNDPRQAARWLYSAANKGRSTYLQRGCGLRLTTVFMPRTIAR